MRKLVIVSYYGSKQPITSAEHALNKMRIDVYNFPLYQYMYDQHDKKPNYLELFIDFIRSNSIEWVLWWFINVPLSDFEYIKRMTGVKYLFFNWDEPFNWKLCGHKKKAPFIDKAFITCAETVQKYQKKGVSYAVTLYPGFNPTINYPIKDVNTDDYTKYACDISICITNMYSSNETYPDQYINRQVLIDTIYSNQTKLNYKFYIYGPDSLATLYPDSFKGFVKYEELNQVINYSRINLCTHVLYDKEGYLNERVFLIGGSGGLLLVDHVRGIERVFEPDKEIIMLDKVNYLTQIKHILDNYDQYIPIRKNIHAKCMETYTYDQWAECISQSLGS